MTILPAITAELVARVSHGVYRRQLENNKARAEFDALPSEKQASRTAGYHRVVRHTLQELGFPEPEKPTPVAVEDAAILLPPV